MDDYSFTYDDNGLATGWYDPNGMWNSYADVAAGNGDDALYQYLTGGEYYDYTSDPSILDTVTSGIQGGLSWLGSPTGSRVLSTGLGLLGAYGNYSASQAQAEANRANSKAALARIELENRMAKANQAAELSARASIANILANKGHLAAGQSNPWLNYLYEAQKEGKFTPQGDNPFAGYATGQAVTPYSLDQLMAGLQAMNQPTAKMAHGGSAPMGALSMMGYSDNGADDQVQGALGLIRGEGGGQEDNIDADLSPGEYVFDADVVSSLGDGSNEEGARRLDKMRERVRSHKRKASPKKIPPKAHDPMKYLEGE